MADERRSVQRALPPAQHRSADARAAARRSEGRSGRLLRTGRRRDYRIEVIEQRPDTITAVIPAPPQPGTDAAARLAEVSGRIFDLLHTSGVGGYLIPDESLTWVLRDMRALWAADHSGPTADH